MTQPTSSEPFVMPKVDLGDDRGWCEVTIAGKPLRVCPLEEINRILRFSEASEFGKDAPIYSVAQAWLKKQHDVDASADMALAYWDALEELDKRVADFFEQTRSSQGISTSTRVRSKPEKNTDSSPQPDAITLESNDSDATMEAVPSMAPAQSQLLALAAAGEPDQMEDG